MNRCSHLDPTIDSLMVWNLIQRELRKSPGNEKGKLKDFNKRITKRPTGYLLMSQLSGAPILKHGLQRFLPKNGLRSQRLAYLEALGFDKTIYLKPPPKSRTQRCP